MDGQKKMGRKFRLNYCNYYLFREFIYETHDMVAYRYDILKPLGKGSFGIVFKCYDFKEKDFIALKIVRCKK